MGGIPAVPGKVSFTFLDGVPRWRGQGVDSSSHSVTHPIDGHIPYFLISMLVEDEIYGYISSTSLFFIDMHPRVQL